jgi:hypothetical protein
VSQWTGLSPDQRLNLHDPKTLARLETAMIRQEQGRRAVDVDQVLAAIGAGPSGPEGPAGPAGRGAGPAAAAAAPTSGQVQVDVRVQHNGDRAVAKARSSGAVRAHARVEHSLHPIPA